MAVDRGTLGARPERDFRCPTDRALLVKRGVAGVVVDACPVCGRHWIDAAEVESVSGSRRLAQRLDRASPRKEFSPFGCPRCGGSCFPVAVGAARLDACADCRGVWSEPEVLAFAASEAERGGLLRRVFG